MAFQGAGGSEGGMLRFFIGFVMFVAGAYLLLDAIVIDNRFGLGYGFGIMGFQVTTGYVLIPFMFGIGMIFYNSKNYLGWFLALASIIMLVFGVITSIQFRFRSMTAFQIIMILILLIGGLGLFLSSIRKSKYY